MAASIVHLENAFLHTSPDAYAEKTKKKHTHTINPRTNFFLIFDLLSQLIKQKTYHPMLIKQKTTSPQERTKKKARPMDEPDIYSLLQFTLW